jgi:thymidylate kinase
MRYFQENLLVKKVKTQKLGHMTKLNVWLKDNQFLSIDAIHELSRKGVKFMEIEEVLRNRVQVNHHFRFALADDYQYCQAFYTLNGADVDEKYHPIFEKGFDSQNLTLTIRHLQMLAGEGTADAFRFSVDKQIQLKKFIKKFNRNPFTLVGRKLKYYQDFLTTAMFHRGKVITFSGVDGAGKTTVIDIVSKRLKNKYRKDIVLLRHRPGVLPILSTIKHGSKAKAEQHASVTLPRQGNNKSKLSSMMRFCYYFLDYQIGQVYVYFKYVLRGKVVVYDRYYFDFINDAKRSNINLNRNFIKSLYRFIYKPDVNFYLFNDAETILSRKAELSAQDINQMNEKYQDLFSEYQQSRKSNYIKVKNDDLNQTIALIMGELRKIA